MSKAETAISGRHEDGKTSFEALLSLKGRDMEIKHKGDPEVLRGPCTIYREKEEESHPEWIVFKFPWLASGTTISGWQLKKDYETRRIAVPGSTQISFNEDGSAELHLKGNVDYRVLPEGDILKKPQLTS